MHWAKVKKELFNKLKPEYENLLKSLDFKFEEDGEKSYCYWGADTIQKLRNIVLENGYDIHYEVEPTYKKDDEFRISINIQSVEDPEKRMLFRKIFYWTNDSLAGKLQQSYQAAITYNFNLWFRDAFNMTNLSYHKKEDKVIEETFEPEGNDDKQPEPIVNMVPTNLKKTKTIKI